MRRGPGPERRQQGRGWRQGPPQVDKDKGATEDNNGGPHNSDNGTARDDNDDDRGGAGLGGQCLPSLELCFFFFSQFT
jgi:hypothetical protein